MSEKKIRHENPYRNGKSYFKIFAWMMKTRIFTLAEIREFTKQEFGKVMNADINVLNGPREKSKIGDCRGSVSARGDLHYSAKLNRATKMGVKEPQRYMLRWRKEPLERKTRQSIPEVKQVKTPAVKAKAPAKVATKEAVTLE
jgi:hypothetical protein